MKWFLEKSGGTFLYLRLVEEDKALDISQPESLPDKLDGIFKQNFNRYFPDAQAFGNKTEPFLRLLVAAPGPLPEQMGRQILGWSPRDLTLNVTEPMGSLLQQRDGGLVGPAPRVERGRDEAIYGPRALSPATMSSTSPSSAKSTST